MKCLILSLLGLLALSGCNNEHPPTRTVQAGNFKVDMLFKVDGCRVYRFDDGGYTRYFSNCGPVSDAAQEITDDINDAAEGA